MPRRPRLEEEGGLCAGSPRGGPLQLGGEGGRGHVQAQKDFSGRRSIIDVLLFIVMANVDRSCGVIGTCTSVVQRLIAAAWKQN